MRSLNNIMDKKYIIAWFLLLVLTSSCQAFLFWDKTKLQDYRLSNVFLILSQKPDSESLYIYDRIITSLENKEDEKLQEIVSKLKLRQQSIISERKSLTRHKSMILKFWAWAQSIDFLESKQWEIKNTQSVFLFRTWKVDLPWYQIESITKKLKEINPDIFIFIDQEGGLINRYVEFDNEISFANYLETDKYIKTLYNTLSDETRIGIWYLFPQNYSYFPSLTKIGEIYTGISNEDKQNYLDLVAYMRLKTLHDRHINSYGLVMDLDRWNPVIKNYRRSFSPDLESYKKLWDAFIKASKKTGVSLYLKHFPGHGAGQVDSHKWILDYTNDTKYLEENLELFTHMLDNKDYTQIWLMIWHMYVPNSLKSEFENILSKADYLLTDDLAMRWYTLATWWEKNDVFFTTDVVFDNENTILVDSLINPNIR